MPRAEPAGDSTLAGPRDVSGLYGQGAAETELLAAYRSGRMHHGWLLTGPRGIGKATLAHRLARFITAFPDHRAGPVVEATDLSASDDLPAIRRIRASAFPDLVEIAAITTQTAAGRGQPIIKVDHIHNGLRALETTAGAGGWRIVIVDAADDMNAAAANAILKRLEEPPQRTLFILVSHAPGRLLPTIRSRCRRLELPPLGADDLKNAIAGAWVGETVPDIPAEIFMLAGGSAGEALRLVDQGGAALARDMIRLIGTLPGLDMSMAHKLANRLTAQKSDPEFRLFCDLLLDWLAEAVRSAETGSASRFAGLEPDGGFAMFRVAPLAPWAALWENLSEIRGRTMGLNLDRKLFLMNVFFALEATARGQTR